MNPELWKLAQQLYTAIPGRVQNSKCGRLVSAQIVTMAIYKELEHYVDDYEQRIIYGNALVPVPKGIINASDE